MHNEIVVRIFAYNGLKVQIYCKQFAWIWYCQLPGDFQCINQLLYTKLESMRLCYHSHLLKMRSVAHHSIIFLPTFISLVRYNRLVRFLFLTFCVIWTITDIFSISIKSECFFSDSIISIELSATQNVTSSKGVQEKYFVEEECTTATSETHGGNPHWQSSWKELI